MILPIALAKEAAPAWVSNLPYIEAVRENIRMAMAQYEKVEQLKTQYIEEISKDDKRFNKALHVKIRDEDSQLSRLLKNVDYAALVVGSFPNNKVIDYDEFRKIRDTITDPILVRGIAAGKIINYVKEKGQDYYFIETGYFGNYSCEGNPNARKMWHRIVKNNMQHDAVMDVPDDRLQILEKYDTRLKWKGWKKGSKILLVAPSEGPCKYYGVDKDQWMADTISTIKQHTDREIVVREKGSRTERTSVDTIYDAFDKDIFAVVTYNSIAAAEAVSYGIPAFALAPTVADPVTLKDLSKIETPYYPEEDFIRKWLSSVAYGQFNMTEMLLGTAWKMVLENAERPTISY